MVIITCSTELYNFITTKVDGREVLADEKVFIIDNMPCVLKIEPFLDKITLRGGVDSIPTLKRSSYGIHFSFTSNHCSNWHYDVYFYFYHDLQEKFSSEFMSFILPTQLKEAIRCNEIPKQWFICKCETTEYEASITLIADDVVSAEELVKDQFPGDKMMTFDRANSVNFGISNVIKTYRSKQSLLEYGLRKSEVE